MGKQTTGKEEIKKQLEGQATANQIKEWKESFGDVHHFIDGGKIVYFKSPGRTEIGHGMTVGAGNVLEVAIATMEACYLGGSQELMTDEIFVRSAALRFDDLTAFRKVEMGKL